jgi:hypothetical protein
MPPGLLWLAQKIIGRGVKVIAQGKGCKHLMDCRAPLAMSVLGMAG